MVKEKKIIEGIDSDDLKYPCSACEMVFDTKEELREHSKEHNK